MKPELLSGKFESPTEALTPTKKLARILVIAATLVCGAWTAQAASGPKMTVASSATVVENASKSVPITVSESGTNATVSSVTITATSSDTNLVADSDLVITGSGASQTLTITPAPNAYGSATITLVATDSASASATNKLALSVAFVNQGPSNDLSTNLVLVTEETASFSESGFVSNMSAGPSSQSGETWHFVAKTASGSPTNALFTTAPAVSSSGTLTFKPKTHSYGTNVVTLIMVNTGGTADGGTNSFTNSFVIGIVQTNHVPVFNKVANATVLENATNALTVNVTIWDYDENATNCVLTATSSDTNVSAISVTGTNIGSKNTNVTFTLTLSPVTNEFGVVTNTLVATEDGFSTTNTFKLTITHVNQAPSFSFNTNVVISNSYSVGEETPSVVQDDFVTNMSAGPDDQSSEKWHFTVQNPEKASTNVLFTTAPAISTNGILTFKPKAHSYGTNLLTVIMTTSGGTANHGVDTATNTFLLAVTQTNHAPTIVKVPNKSVLEDSTNLSISINVWDYDKQATNFVLTATSGDTNLVNLTITGTNINATNNTNVIFTLTMALVTNQYGVTTNTLVATEGSLSSTNTFKFTVTHVNQAPSFDFNTNLVTINTNFAVSNVFSVEEETVSVSNLNFLTNLSAGPANQSNETWKFLVTTAVGKTTNAAFTTLPAIATNGTITFKPKAHSYGTNLVTVIMDTDGGTANHGSDSYSNNFLLAIVQTNHAPTFYTVTNLTTLENSSNVTAHVNVWDYDQNSSNITLTAASGNTNVLAINVSTNVSTPSATNALFTLNITLVTNQYGVITNQLVATEDGLSTTNKIVVTITHVNQAPSFSFNTNFVVSNLYTSWEEVLAVTNVNFLTNISTGPTNQSTETYSFTVTVQTSQATNAQFSKAAAIATNGTLTFYPTAHSYGTNLVTIVMNDSGTTANGGTNAYTNTFLLGIIQTNHTPSFYTVTNVTALENATNITAHVNVWDYDKQSSNLTLTATSGNTNVLGISVSTNISVQSPTNALFTLNLTLVTNQYGVITNQLVATEDGLSTTNNIVVTITHVNQAPSFSYNTNFVVSNLYTSWEEVLAVTNVNFLTNISTGPTNQSNETYSFTVTVQTNQATNAQFSKAASITTNGALTFYPEAHSYGTNLFTVVMNDSGTQANGGTNAYTNTFLLGIIQTNHAPTIEVTTKTVYENGSNFTVGINVWDYDKQSSNFTLTATSLNTNLETVSVSTNISIVSSTNAVLTLSFALGTNQFGVVTNTLVATEGSLSSTNDLVVTITFVNQPPSYTFDTNVADSNILVIPENTGVTNLAGFLTNLSAGPINQSNETWGFKITTTTTNSTNATFTQLSAATNGTLTIDATTNSFGTNIVTVVMTNSGGTANGATNAYTNSFQLQVQQILYPPTFIGISNYTILENGTAGLVQSFSLYNHLNTNFVVTALSTNTNVINVTVGGSGALPTLIYAPVTNQYGTNTITVTASANGQTNSTNITLGVEFVNQAPSFDLAIASVTADLYDTLATFSNVVTNILAGPTNQNWETVGLLVTNNNSNLFVNGGYPAIDTNGTLTFTPAAIGGTVTVGIRATNSGGTANGGVVDSPVQTMTITIPANSFASVSGSYAGLYYDTTTMSNTTSGYLALTLVTNGTVTGYVLGEGNSNTYSGQFDISNSSAAITAGPLNLALTLDSGSSSITGTISNTTESWDEPVQGYRANTTAGSLAGYYLMAYPGDGDATNGPSGASIFSMTIGSTGGIALSGTMADNTAAVQTGQLSAEGYYPLYVPLYSGGSQGSLIGWLQFTNVAPTLQGSPTLTWFNTTSSLYSAGFTNQATPIASPYSSSGSSVFGFNSATFVSSGGILETNLTNTISITNNGIYVIPTNYNLTLSITVGTGEITGTFIDPNSGDTDTIHAALIQSSNMAPGFFIGPSQVGSVLLDGN